MLGAAAAVQADALNGIVLAKKDFVVSSSSPKKQKIEHKHDNDVELPVYLPLVTYHMPADLVAHNIICISPNFGKLFAHFGAIPGDFGSDCPEMGATPLKAGRGFI